MTTYIKVGDIKRDYCDGCALYDDDHACEKLRRRVSPDKCDVREACHHVIWIEDTDAARLAYITLKLEN